MCRKTMKMQLQDATGEVFSGKARKKNSNTTHEMLKILNANSKHTSPV